MCIYVCVVCIEEMMCDWFSCVGGGQMCGWCVCVESGICGGCGCVRYDGVKCVLCVLGMVV
jgi:hypothetical protein